MVVALYIAIGLALSRFQNCYGYCITTVISEHHLYSASR
jgi:hypothetical protein